MLGKWSIGVMQGRLLPKYRGRYQAHPKGYWQDEFPVAARQGLELIEFILDFEDAPENPLLSDPSAIARAASASGVAVRSICADYFMEAPLHSADPEVVTSSRSVLERLIANAPSLGVRDIVIPCVDQSSLARLPDAADRLMAGLAPLLDKAAGAKLNLALETDLPPSRFATLLERFGGAPVTVNYDIGNSASLGFDPREEWDAYGDRVTDVHIKDRVRGGGSVELGTGDADIPAVLKLMAAFRFDGPVIMQAFRDDEGIEVFRRQKDWLFFQE